MHKRMNTTQVVAANVSLCDRVDRRSVSLCGLVVLEIRISFLIGRVCILPGLLQCTVASGHKLPSIGGPFSS